MDDKLIRSVSEEELAKVDDNSLNANQLAFMFQRTPKQYIYQRPAKGGGSWS